MLDREEYIEQAYLFRVFAERIAAGIAAQEALVSIGQEVLATSKLPMAIDYLVGELKLVGTLSTAMVRLPPLLHRLPDLRDATGRGGGGPVRHADGAGDARARGDLPRRGGDAAGAVLLPLRVPVAEPPRLRPRPRRVAADDIFDADWKAWIDDGRPGRWG